MYDNNIYIRESITDASSEKKVTLDGSLDIIFNGIPDWVYEEEILSTNKANYFPPGGSKMAFVSEKVDTFLSMVQVN